MTSGGIEITGERGGGRSGPSSDQAHSRLLQVIHAAGLEGAVTVSAARQATAGGFRLCLRADLKAAWTPGYDTTGYSTG